MDPYTSGFYIADTLEDTLLGYVMANRQLQENARQFNRNLAERQRQYDTSFGEDKRQYDAAIKLAEDMRMSDKIMAEQLMSQNRFKEERENYDRARKEYLDAQSKKFFGIGFNKQRSAKQFEKEVGIRPELRPMQLPDYPFLPSFGVEQAIGSQSPTLQRSNLLRTYMLGGR
tara:strand:+ start:658 stop:1173 length:516 start_codon:yes stop_codon:yes gene_type:complete